MNFYYLSDVFTGLEWSPSPSPPFLNWPQLQQQIKYKRDELSSNYKL